MLKARVLECHAVVVIVIFLSLSTTISANKLVASSEQSMDRAGRTSFHHSRRLRNQILESNITCPTTTTLGLPVGDINVVVVTDIHGWIAGQHTRHEPELNFDFGDLISFYERLQACAGSSDGSLGDWFLLFNGDFMDGTGLSTVPPKYLAPLLQKIPFSALNVGNHELYFNEVVDYMMLGNTKNEGEEGFITSWGGNYLATNVDYVHSKTPAVTRKPQPFGNRFTYLHAHNSNTTILTFGFLYNFFGHCNHTRVRLVEDVLREEWFEDILSNYHFDAIIVLAHMDAVDPLVYKILKAIRSHVGPLMPIQFLTGHSHRRHFEVLDPFATSFEAGRYMDTVGFTSFPVLDTVKDISSNPHSGDERNPKQSSTSLFRHSFLNANVEEVATTVFGGSLDSDFSTPNGRAIRAEMQQIQLELGLLDVLAKCAPSKYELAKPMNDTSSLWWLYINEVLPNTLFPRLLKSEGTGRERNTSKNVPIFLQGTGALRYDLIGPTIVVDDIIAVSPFHNPIYQVGTHLTAQELNMVLDSLQVDQPALGWESTGFAKFGVAGKRPANDDEHELLYDLYTVEFHLKQVMEQVVQIQETMADDHVGQDVHSFVPKPLFTSKQSKKHPPNRLETTQLWMEYAREKWKCPGRRHSKRHTPDGKFSWFDSVGATNLMHENPDLKANRINLQSQVASLSLRFVVVAVAVAFIESMRVRQRRYLLRPQPYRNKEEDSHGRQSIGESTPLLLQLN